MKINVKCKVRSMVEEFLRKGSDVQICEYLRKTKGIVITCIGYEKNIHY